MDAVVKCQNIRCSVACVMPLLASVISFITKLSFLSIGELPKLYEKISILMQANVLIADWYVAHSFPHL